ncbi:MAG TPA: ATP-grasp domain-containing protein [Chloroflexota bacterium]
MMLFRAGASSEAFAATATPATETAFRGVRPASRATELDVLLLDGEHRQTLAALRTYARAGLRAGAVAGQSDADWAPSLRSRLCTLGASVPDLGSDAERYVEAILDLLDQHPTRVLLAAHDGSIQALRLRRADIERRTALPLASEAALDIAVDKTRTLSLAADLGVAVPVTVSLNDMDDIAPAMREVGFPAVLKPDASWVVRDGRGVRLSPNVVQTVDEARRTFAHVLEEGGRALMQQFLPGRREAVSLFYARRRFWGRLAQVSYREWPVLGGASVFCETIPLLPDITADAERLVRAMDLEGCSMVEFRRDREGRPVLMEVNPRMGGSVGLAIAAGVNFPRMLYAWALGETLQQTHEYRIGARLRWLAGDVWNLKCAFEMQGHPDIPSRSKATRTFLLDFLRPAVTLDGLDLADMYPALAEVNKIVFQHGLRRLRQVLWPARTHNSER